MVVKSTTKKKLMDIGFPQVWAHKMANDAKWVAILDMDKEELTNKVLSDAGWTSTFTTGIKFSKEDELLWEELIVNALNMWKVEGCLAGHFYPLNENGKPWQYNTWDDSHQKYWDEIISITYDRLKWSQGHWGRKGSEKWEYCNGMTKNDFMIGYNRLSKFAKNNCGLYNSGPSGNECRYLTNLYTWEYNTKSPIINWPSRNPMEVKE